MADFPVLAPDSIEYNLGDLNISEAATVASGPVRFRHSLRNQGHELVLVYSNLIESDAQLIRDHYNQVDGTHGYFNVPSAIWGSATTVVPSDSLYRYTGPPEEEHLGVYFNVSVTLRILQGWDLRTTLSGGEALPAQIDFFQNLGFDGTAPFELLAYDADPPDAEKLLLGKGAQP